MTIRMLALGEEKVGELARSPTLGAGLVRRARIARHAVAGLNAPEIAARMGRCGATVRFRAADRIALDQAVDDLDPAGERNAVQGASPVYAACLTEDELSAGLHTWIFGKQATAYSNGSITLIWRVRLVSPSR